MKTLTWQNSRNLKKIDKGLDFSVEYCYNKLNVRRCIPMAYIINDDCISCGACEAECPVSAISEGDGKYVINADECLECGACASACPVGAPVAE